MFGRRLLSLAPLGLVLVFSPAARAQSPSAPVPPPADVPELVTDRPDFTESSQVIPRGWYQLESGASYEGDGRERRNFSAPAALMRVGLGRRTELRLGVEGLLSETVAGRRSSGYSDIEIGAKTRLLSQDRHGVDLALLPAVSLPTGADGFTSGGVDPTMKVAWGKDLPAGVGMTGNVNVSSLSDALGRFRQEAVSLSFGRAITGPWGVYAEAYAVSRLGRGERRAVTVNGGVTRTVGAQFQFDIEAGHGMSAAAPDWFLAAGFAILRPFGRR